MPAGSSGTPDNPLLRGLFGVFQNVASARASTADLWTALRVNAATWQFQAQGGGELPPVAELEAQGRQILSAQGVDLQAVNRFRALSNQWRTAKEQLQKADPFQQIQGSMIFQPPWATTTAEGVPSNYRIRVQWETVDATGVSSLQWRAYELGGQPTTIEDALQAAATAWGKVKGSADGNGVTGPFVNDYAVEQI